MGKFEFGQDQLAQLQPLQVLELAETAQVSKAKCQIQKTCWSSF